jgi:hypothetical protein
MLYDVYIQNDDLSAVGILNYATEELTVLKGSERMLVYADHFEGSSAYELMRELESKGILRGTEFLEDYTFSSPSAAASVILGGSTNGKTAWRTIGHVSIKEAVYNE